MSSRTATKISTSGRAIHIIWSWKFRLWWFVSYSPKKKCWLSRSCWPNVSQLNIVWSTRNNSSQYKHDQNYTHSPSIIAFFFLAHPSLCPFVLFHKYSGLHSNKRTSNDVCVYSSWNVYTRWPAPRQQPLRKVTCTTFWRACKHTKKGGTCRVIDVQSIRRPSPQKKLSLCIIKRSKKNIGVVWILPHWIIKSIRNWSSPLSRSRRAAASISLGLGSYLASGDSRRSGTGRPEEAPEGDGCGLTRSCCCCCWTFLTVVWTPAETVGKLLPVATMATAMPSIKASKETRQRRLSGAAATSASIPVVPLIIYQANAYTRKMKWINFLILLIHFFK